MCACPFHILFKFACMHACMHDAHESACMHASFISVSIIHACMHACAILIPLHACMHACMQVPFVRTKPPTDREGVEDENLGFTVYGLGFRVYCVELFTNY